MPCYFINNKHIILYRWNDSLFEITHSSSFIFNTELWYIGQLFGGPYDNNYYLGTLFQLDKDAATQDVEVGKGDELLGDTLRSTLAEVTAQICETDAALNMDFAVVNVKGDVPSVDGIQDKLKSLVWRFLMFWNVIPY